MSQECPQPPGRVAPRIDRNVCEAKEDCVRVCPYGVFEIRRLAEEDRARLSLLGRLKSWAHGGKQAYAVKADQCHGCGLCVTACPERAIRLVPWSDPERSGNDGP